MHFGECCFRVSGPVLQQVHVLVKGDDEGFVVAGSQDLLEKNAGGLLLGFEAGSHRGADVEEDADAQGQRALLLEEMNGGRRLMVVENGEILAGQLVLEVSVGVGNGEAQIDFVNALHDAEFGSVACRRSSHGQRARLILLGDHKAYSAESQQKRRNNPRFGTSVYRTPIMPVRNSTPASGANGDIVCPRASGVNCREASKPNFYKPLVASQLLVASRTLPPHTNPAVQKRTDSGCG